ncbi:pilus assembly protein TadG-related protein [Brevundimonas albigilva]|uniref:pilus assembly protein TadG-related protein n=1 Tax=Brevundimonas albigilva TaxID=1312364 RepID=UPI00201B6B28|nr:pilus assembly protein TadG-related protein [Brevundimonas albigilva]UQV17487.1 pilus assembly protein TadG-related protein [Brevundimonas albigilva]
MIRARKLLTDRRGAVGVTAAAGLALLALVAAMAIDLGGLALHARRLQGAADLAALAAAGNLDGAAAAAQATAQANVARGPLSVETAIGRYTPDKAVARREPLQRGRRRTQRGPRDADGARAAVLQPVADGPRPGRRRP